MDKEVKKLTMYRIISLLGAVAIWVFVVISQDPVMNNKFYSIPISYSSLSTIEKAELQIISIDDNALDLSLRGKRSLVLSKSKYSAFINLSNISSPGNYTLDIDISRPDGVELRNKNPEKANIYIDKIITVEKPIVVTYKGESKPGYEINVLSQTANGFITGPSLIVHNVAYLNAVADISDVTANTVKEVLLTPMDSSGKPIVSEFLRETKVNLSFIAMQSKTVHIKPQFDLSDKVESFEVSPNMITIEGNKDRLLDINELLTEPVILDSEAEKTTAAYETKLIFPEGISPNKNSPVSVTVKVAYK